MTINKPVNNDSDQMPETPELLAAILLTKGVIKTATADATFTINGQAVKAGMTAFLYCDLTGIFNREPSMYSVQHADLKNIWQAIEDPNNKGYGLYVWSAMKSNQKPLAGVVKQLKEKGVWNEQLEALPPNIHDFDFSFDRNLPN